MSTDKKTTRDYRWCIVPAMTLGVTSYHLGCNYCIVLVQYNTGYDSYNCGGIV